MIWIPFIGALALAIGSLSEKLALKIKKIDIKLYQTASFFAISLLLLPLLFFFWKLSPEALNTKNILIFLLIITFSIVANLLSFYSLKREKITNLEPARILEPLFVIILAIFFSIFIDSVLYERNIKVIIPALIAASALILSHINRNHLSFNKYILAAILGSFLFALELVTSRIILDFYSPITFYFFRCFAIFTISLLIFRPKIKNLDKKSDYIILLAAIFWVVYRIVVYYGYMKYGITFTTLITMLGPIMIYFFAWKFLKEKPTKRNIAAAIVIIACVLYATLM